MRLTSIALVIAIVVIVSPPSAVSQSTITIDLVTNLSDDSTLPGGLENAIVLRYNAAGAAPGEVYWPANGWVIYSPDGADWGSVQAEPLPAFNALGFDKMFVNHFTKNGGSGSFGVPQTVGGGNSGGHDSVAVVVAALFDEPGYGMPTGFNDIAVQIRFQTSRSDAGLHICIDTCGQAPGGTWEWANATTGALLPEWTGARCWTIGCCAGKVGDVDGVGGDDPTITDLAGLVDILFLSQTPPDCLAEADVNLSGTLVEPPLELDDITVTDLAKMVDHLFLSQAPLPDCP